MSPHTALPLVGGGGGGGRGSPCPPSSNYKRFSHSIQEPPVGVGGHPLPPGTSLASIWGFTPHPPNTGIVPLFFGGGVEGGEG